MQVTVQDESDWWKSLLTQPVLSLIDVHSMPDYSMVSVAGILAMMSMEEKVVKSETKFLLIMKIVDRTGCIEVRSWTHTQFDFSMYRDRPILIKRLRVTSYAGSKMLELIEGKGSPVEAEFPHAEDLAKFWKEPAKP